MPLSKERQREVMRNHMREKRKMFIPKEEMFIPKVRYAPNHFGEVKSLYHARQFFSTLRY